MVFVVLKYNFFYEFELSKKMKFIGCVFFRCGVPILLKDKVNDYSSLPVDTI